MLKDFETMPSVQELEAEGLNTKQIRALHSLIDAECTTGSYHFNRDEWKATKHVKSFRLSMIGKKAFVCVTVGLIGEKGMQRILCRSDWSGTIGTRGGYDPSSRSKFGTKADAKRSPKIYGWHSI